MPYRDRVFGLKRELMNDLDMIVRAAPAGVLTFWVNDTTWTLEERRAALRGLPTPYGSFGQNSSFRITSMIYLPGRDMSLSMYHHYDLVFASKPLGEIPIEAIAELIDFTVAFQEKQTLTT